MRPVALALVLLAVAAAPARAETGTVAMDDGIRLAYVLDEPAGTPPAGGWPGVVVMHGLGGSAQTMEPAARFFADHGYAALAFSVRGQGGSGGQFGLAGPRDVADMKAMVAWLERRPEVDDRVGCLGISLGGGECWNATPSGIFGAVAPVATWTDLATALWPGGVARSGVLSQLAAGVPASGLGALPFGGALSPLVEPLLAQRSVAARLGSIATPVYLFQGREDWVFDVDQALAAFERLRGPKRLYVGDFGHPPATFASPDFPGYVLGQAVAWFDRWLKGGPAVPDALVLSDQTGTRRTTYRGIPPTRVVHAGVTTHALTTFGDSTVRVRVTRLGRYPQLVAVVLAGSRVVTHGAVVPRLGPNTIRLADYAVSVPAGAKIRVQLGPDGGKADPAYAAVGAKGTIRLGKPRLDLRVLR